MVTIVDYGLGNVQALVNIYTRLNIPVAVGNTAAKLEAASRLVLPGVGAFDWAMDRLNHSGLRPVLDQLVLKQRKPVLGICVGMQMMAERSEEGVRPGLGWIPGEVIRFKPRDSGPPLNLPHMGWNDVVPLEHSNLFRNLAAPRYYFLHSYHMVAAERSHVLCEAEYGYKFTAAVRAENVFGAQFHPEKSHNWGIELLKNFAHV
jgi:imidazole glycerol-phosphate synthase subunit HisH